MTIDTEHFRDLLTERRERVEHALQYLHLENPGDLADETGELVTSSAENHLAEVATATYDRELDYALEENSEQLLAAIDHALERLDEGEYGRCEVCGEEILVERLEAIPWTTLCLSHARSMQRG